MQDGICPECNSTEVYASVDKNHHNRIVLDWLGGIKPIIFVCINCGYTSRYVESKYFFRIRKNWVHVQDMKKPARSDKRKSKRKNDES